MKRWEATGDYARVTVPLRELQAALSYTPRAPGEARGEVALLPCPFCGSEHPQWVGSADGDYVECGSCLAMMRPHDPDVPNEVARWNTRFRPSARDGECERLREVLEEAHISFATIAEEKAMTVIGQWASKKAEMCRAALSADRSDPAGVE